MSVSVIIPFRNEEGNVVNTLDKVLAVFKKHKLNGEIIAVEDHSTDGTPVLLDYYKRFKGVKVIHRTGESQGVEVGYAIRDGLRAARSEFVAIMMGDLSEDPEDLVRMLKAIKGCDFVVGTRFFAKGWPEGYPLSKLIANRLCNWFCKRLFGLHTNDISNAFKLYRREALQSIEIESPNFDVFVEMPLKLIKAGCTYTQIPVSYHKRRWGHPKLKVWKEGPMYFRTVMKIWLS